MNSASMQFPFVAAALITFAGACIAFQAPLNAALARGVQSPLVAAAISFGLGFLVLTVIALISGEGRNFAYAFTVSKWLLIGGFFGAFYVWSMVWSLPRLGVFTAVAMLAFGQIMAGMMMDKMGAFGMPVHDISLNRILAAALVMGGVVLSRF